MGYLGTAWVALGVLLISKIWNLFNILVWRPYAIRKWFAKQGISGPPYSFISGSLHEMKTLRMQASNTVLGTHSHDIIPRILPHHHKWASQYGEVFLYWQGTEPRLFMVEPEIAKDLFSNRTGFYVKQKMSPSIMALFGKGLVLSEGSDWQRHRKVVSPAFNLDKLKVNLFLLEVLRLYCPVIELYRTTTKDTKLGDFMIPKNTTVAIPMVMIHRNKKYWGEDADEFNPLRFADGVSKAATHPNAFLAFSTGPRACIGQNFTMLEAKTAVAMILQRFSLSLSPEYKHAPMNELTLQPQFGLLILLSIAH